MTNDPREDGSPSLQLGEVVDSRYELTEILGEGGMGIVYRAVHLRLRRPFALKVLHPHLADQPEVVARFAREASASAALDHPQVVSALDYGSLDGGGYYLVMPLVRGITLTDHLHGRGALPWREACTLGEQVADVLAAAHSGGVVHRDLKPDNLLLERRDDGTTLVKVLDFGVAHVRAELDEGPAEARHHVALTRLGTIIGTPGYMAPEQATGEKVDERADLYSLGVCLWEMVAGRELFDEPDLPRVLQRQLTTSPTSLGELSDAPSDLSELVAGLLSHAADERPGPASSIRDSLRQLAYGAGGNAKLERVASVAATALAHPVADPTPVLGHRLAHDGAIPAALPTTGSAPTPGPRWRVWAPLLALAVLGLMGVTGVAVSAMVSQSYASTRPMIPKLPLDSPQRRGRSEEATAPPAGVAQHVRRLLESRDRRERREAANHILALAETAAVAEWVRAVAELEGGEGCSEREAALAKIRELGDSRTLPTLRRYDDTPRRGCGFLRTQDCYGCIRSELAETLESLGGTQ